MGSRLEKNSATVRKRIESHTFDGEDGEEYSASTFGGFTDYMRRKKIKLQNLDAQLRAETNEKPPIFRNVVAFVNGYTQPSLQDLHVLIVSHGGGFLQYLDGKTAVTHIIASQLTPKKKAEFAKYRIVKPAWVVDSVGAGRLLPWENYRVVDEGVSQKILGFGSGTITSQANKQQHSYKEASETSWYTSQVKDVAEKLNATDSSSRTLDNLKYSFDETLLEQLADASTQDSVHEASAGALGLFREASNTTPKPRLPITAESTETDIEPGNAHEATAATATVEPLPAPSLLTVKTEIESQPDLEPEPDRAPPKKLTAEEHNAILLQNPHMAKSSTANPDFLNQYYRESRLHHLSSWKAELKAQLQARASERSSQHQKPKRPPGTRRYIMHVDFDSFFAAVSLRKNPHLKDKPVVVAHGAGPGSEIASCNYPARKFGIKNGMWMKHALELCKEINVLPYDYLAYEEASKYFYDSILTIEGVVQSISIDEALVDVSELCIKAGGSDGRSMHENAILNEQEKANAMAESLRATVREKTGCEVSIGIGGNILLAKVALRKAKPAGQFLLRPEAVLDFLADLTVLDLPGFAYSVANKLEEIGVKFVKDIRMLNKERLMSILGPKTGEKIWDYSRGIDRQEVGEQVVRKSVSAEVNWGIRFINQQQAEEFVMCLCEELAKRLLEQLVKGRQLTMKIMRKAADAGLDPPKNLGHGKCDTFNKSVVLGVATNDKTIIGKEAVAVLRSYSFPPGELRGLGVQMQKLEPLKPVTAAGPSVLEGSQRRLQFKKPAAISENIPAHSLLSSDPFNPVQITPSASEKTSLARTTSGSRTKRTADPIEEMPTPKKMKTSPAISEMFSIQDDRNTPLNISGTQFIAPTQIDPSVLAELPADIRARLAPKQKSRQNLENFIQDRSPSVESRSRSQSPFVSDSELALPNQSQLDPATLAELPEDVRNELLAQYNTSSKLNPNRGMQQLLPQSPRKSRPIMSKKTSLTPTKKHKVKSLLHKGRSKGTSGSSTLTQSNFVSANNFSAAPATDSLIADEDISVSFLEELPEEIRLEIIAERKRERMKQKAGLNVGTARRKPKVETPDPLRGQQKLFLPKQPPLPTFTSRKLSALPDLRTAMSSWVQAFSGDGESGPYEEDTEALAIYLGRVVSDERDLSKAQAVVEWLSYVVGDWPFSEEHIRTAWRAAIVYLKGQVQLAVGARGLAPLEFDE